VYEIKNGRISAMPVALLQHLNSANWRGASRASRVGGACSRPRQPGRAASTWGAALAAP
jgi:hypothetical protein